MLDMMCKVNATNYICANRQFPVCLDSSACDEHSRLINIDANDYHATVSQRLTLKEQSDTSKLTAHASDTTFQIDASRTMEAASKGDALFPLNF